MVCHCRLFPSAFYISEYADDFKRRAFYARLLSRRCTCNWLPFEAQRLRLVREPELFEDRPEDELREVFAPDVLADLDLDDPLPPDDCFAVDLPAPVEREEDAELLLLFDPDDALLPAERDLPLPLDLPADDDGRFADELLDDDFDLLPAECSLSAMFEASAVCTTLAAPSTAPIAALVKSVPAASAAFDNKPLDLRLLLLEL